MTSAFEIRLNLIFRRFFRDEQASAKMCNALANQVRDNLIATDEAWGSTFIATAPTPELSDRVLSVSSARPSEAVVYVKRMVDYIEYSACFEDGRKGTMIDQWGEYRVESQETFD